MSNSYRRPSETVRPNAPTVQTTVWMRGRVMNEMHMRISECGVNTAFDSAAGWTKHDSMGIAASLDLARGYYPQNQPGWQEPISWSFRIFARNVKPNWRRRGRLEKEPQSCGGSFRVSG